MSNITAAKLTSVSSSIAINIYCVKGVTSISYNHRLRPINVLTRWSGNIAP